MTEVPQHLLDRSKKRRQELEIAAQIAAQEVPANLGQMLADQIMSEGVPECSIAASDTSMDAKKLFVTRNAIETFDNGHHFVDSFESTTIVDAENAFMERKVDINWLRSDMKTESGYPIKVGLLKPTEPKERHFGRKKEEDDNDHNELVLFASIRDNIAFPLVYFNSAGKDYCPYLRFPGEDEMDAFESQNFYGWGKDDIGSRLEVVLGIQKFIKNPSSSDLSHVLHVTKLEERIQKAFGTFDPEVEDVVAKAFEGKPADEPILYEHVYDGVSIGRVPTQFIVQGSLEEIEGRPAQRQLSVTRRPVSQPTTRLLQQTFVIDQYSGILAVSADGETAHPTPLDLDMLQELLATPKNAELEVVKPKQPAKDGFLSGIFTPRGFATIATGAVVGNSAGKTIATGEFDLTSLPMDSIKPIAVTGLVFASRQVIYYARQALRNRQSNAWWHSEEEECGEEEWD